MWGSCGFPGNSHDSIIFQSTNLWGKVQQGTVISNIAKVIDGIRVSPLKKGDSAFQFSTWLMKPYTNAILSQKQRYFNYRLSRARMVTEGAYGQLKGRLRILLRKCENRPEYLKMMTLSCMALLDLGDTISRKLDLTVDPTSGERRDRDAIRALLGMCQYPPLRDSNQQVDLIRKKLTKKLWDEKQGHGVCWCIFPVVSCIFTFSVGVKDPWSFHCTNVYVELTFVPSSRPSEQESSSASETFPTATGGRVLMNAAIFFTRTQELFLRACIPVTRNRFIHS